MSKSATPSRSPAEDFDDRFARASRRIGIQFNQPRFPHNDEVSFDNVRHFAHGYGDDNPLWCDRSYGLSTRWQALIAPPNFLYAIGKSDSSPTPDEKALLRGDPFAGLGSFQTRMEFEWWHPLRVGDRVSLRTALVGTRLRRSKRFDAPVLDETLAYVYRNQEGQPIAVRRGTWVHAERKPRESDASSESTQQPYTADELAAIDRCYLDEQRRGGEPRYVEDVEIGEALPTIVRGPLRVTDLVIWHMGVGLQLTPPGNFGLLERTRRKVPGLFSPDLLGVQDTLQRVHWDRDQAKVAGLMTAYDYGALRETLLTAICTHWGGDNSWLWRLSCEHRRFVYVGDTYWVKGCVVGKSYDGHRHIVELDLSIENQRGEQVTLGNASILLPSRAADLDLPEPPGSTIVEIVDHEVARQMNATEFAPGAGDS